MINSNPLIARDLSGSTQFGSVPRWAAGCVALSGLVALTALFFFDPAQTALLILLFSVYRNLPAYPL